MSRRCVRLRCRACPPLLEHSRCRVRALVSVSTQRPCSWPAPRVPVLADAMRGPAACGHLARHPRLHCAQERAAQQQGTHHAAPAVPLPQWAPRRLSIVDCLVRGAQCGQEMKRGFSLFEAEATQAGATPRNRIPRPAAGAAGPSGTAGTAPAAPSGGFRSAKRARQTSLRSFFNVSTPTVSAGAACARRTTRACAACCDARQPARARAPAMVARCRRRRRPQARLGCR